MQFQSDILDTPVLVPQVEELSGMGAAYAAGFGLGIYGQEVFGCLKYDRYDVKMDDQMREKKHHGWQEAVGRVVSR